MSLSRSKVGDLSLNSILEECRAIIRGNLENPLIRMDIDSRLYVRTMEKDLLVVKTYLGRKSKLLDIGCGRGHVAVLLASLGFDVFAIDLEVSRGEQLGIEEIGWQKSIWRELSNRFSGVRYDYFDGRQVSAENGAFDAVIAYAVIEHVESELVDGWLEELWRVLKPKGFLFIFRCPRKRSIAEKVTRALGLGSHDILFDEEELKELLTKRSFSILRLEHTDLIPAFPPLLFQGFWNAVTPILFPIERALLKTPLRDLSHYLRVVAQKEDNLQEAKLVD